MEFLLFKLEYILLKHQFEGKLNFIGKHKEKKNSIILGGWGRDGWGTC